MFNGTFKPISMLRLYVALSGVIVACVLIRRLDTPEHEGYQMGFVIALFSAFALADVLVNDFLSKNVVYEWAKRWRNVGFMLLGLVYASTIFFVMQYEVVPVLLICRLIVDSLMCSFVAFAGVGEIFDENQNKPSRGRKPFA